MRQNFMKNQSIFTERLFNLEGLNSVTMLVVSLLVVLVIKCPGAKMV
jgi:hypothetical protein